MKANRREEISEILKSQGVVKVSELAKKFSKSEMTIHRDLKYLEGKGFLKKVYGAAISNPQSEEVYYSYRSKKCLEEKRTIAKKVYDMIEDGDIIAMGGSTSCIEVAKLLKKDKEVTIFTHSPLIINQLLFSPKITLHSIGSYFCREMVHFIGSDVEDGFSKYYFSKCIFSVGSISPELYLTDPYIQLANIKRKMLECSAMSLVIADHSKFGKVAINKFAKINEIDFLFTDEKIDNSYVKKIKDKTNLIIVK